MNRVATRGRHRVPSAQVKLIVETFFYMLPAATKLLKVRGGRGAALRWSDYKHYGYTMREDNTNLLRTLDIAAWARSRVGCAAPPVNAKAAAT